VGAVKETLAYKDLKRKFPEIIADAFEFRKSKLSKKWAAYVKQNNDLVLLLELH
jgi:hypothetical protein